MLEVGSLEVGSSEDVYLEMGLLEVGFLEVYARRLLCDQGSTVPEPSPAH